MEHSTSPWEAFKNAMGEWIILSADGGGVAKVSGHKDARLIAQAPRLYEACKKALEISHNPAVEKILIDVLAEVEGN